MTSGKSRAGSGRRSTIDTYKPAQASECQEWPWRPIPATCPSAPTMVPEAHPSRARRAAMVMVELTLWNHSICRPGKRARTEAVSKGIYSAVNIDRDGGMRDGSGGNEVRPRLGVSAHIRKRAASGNFGLRAVVDQRDFDGRFIGRHIVEQNSRRALRKGLFHFGARSDF